MSIEISKENFKIEERKGLVERQKLIETEVYLNTIEEGLKSINWIDGRVEVLNTMIIKDKLLINGIVKYNIVYKNNEEENSIYALNEIKDFNEEIQLKGITEDMLPSIEANIEYSEHEIKENKIEIRTLINIKSIITEIKKVETIKDIGGNDSFQILKENIKYEEIQGQEESFAEIADTIKVGDNKASIDRVIKLDLQPLLLESTAVEDRLIVSALIVANLIYLGEGEIYSVADEIPFNHFVEMPGILKDSKNQVKLEVVEANYQVEEDEMGQLKLFNLDMKVRVKGKVYEENSRDLIIDIYSTKEYLEIEREEINIPENIDNPSYRENLEFEAPINAIDVLDIKAHHYGIDEDMTDDGILVNGNVDISIYYIDRIGGELSTYKDHFPYKTKIPYSGDLDLQMEIKSQIKGLNFSLKRDSVKIDMNILHDIYIKKDIRINVVKAIEETGKLIDKNSYPSISVYIGQEGDQLWDIAKHYNTTQDEILKSNDLDPGYQLKPGDKIIIEKNVDTKL